VGGIAALAHKIPFYLFVSLRMSKKPKKINQITVIAKLAIKQLARFSNLSYPKTIN
jgi:hypothetical protein